MRTIFLLLSAAVFGLLSLSATAFYPVDGWWWDPNESGRGFNIEMQDDIMFISAYHFRPNGDPVWWVASGQYRANTGTLSADFLEVANGQCPGCPYFGSPDLITGAGSPVTIEFNSAVSAILHWNGESIPIQRYYWSFDLNQPETFLLGEFHFTSGALGVYFGQRLYFDQIIDDDFAAGRVRGGSSSRLAVGSRDPDLGLFSILIDSSASYYQFYVFEMTKDRMEGISWTFLKSDEPSGSGLPFIGHRVASRAYVQSGVGPHELQSLQRSKPVAAASQSGLGHDLQRMSLQHEFEAMPQHQGSASSPSEAATMAVDAITVRTSFQALHNQILHSHSDHLNRQ